MKTAKLHHSPMKSRLCTGFDGVWNLCRARKGQQSCEGSGAQALWGVPKGNGIVQFGEDEVQGRPYWNLQHSERQLR